MANTTTTYIDLISPLSTRPATIFPFASARAAHTNGGALPTPLHPIAIDPITLSPRQLRAVKEFLPDPRVLETFTFEQLYAATLALSPAIFGYKPSDIRPSSTHKGQQACVVDAVILAAVMCNPVEGGVPWFAEEEGPGYNNKPSEAEMERERGIEMERWRERERRKVKEGRRERAMERAKERERRREVERSGGRRVRRDGKEGQERREVEER